MSDRRDDEGRILLLDDESLVTRSLEDLFRLETSWEVASYNRAHDALEAVERQAFDVLISDFLMPETDGLRFLSEARRHQPFASRILLTGYADKSNAVRAINEVGLFHYLEKPWDNEALLIVVRNGIERARLSAELDRAVRELGHRDSSLQSLRTRLLREIL